MSGLKPRLLPLLLLLAVFCATGGGRCLAQQRKRPITKDALARALGINGLSHDELIRQVSERGVDFELTREVERELLAAGARPDLIEAVRANYRAAPSAPPPPTGGANRGTVQAAADKGERAREASPGRESGERGSRLYSEGKFAEAAAAYEEAIRLDPTQPVYYNNLGTAQLDLKQYAEALGSYNQAARLDRHPAAAYYGMGLAYRGLKRYKESVEALERAIRLEPDDPITYAQLGNTYADMGNYADALGALKQALRLRPDYDEVYGYLSLTYDRMDRHQDSLEAARQLVRLKPEGAPGHNRMAYAYNQLGQSQEALKEAQQALGLNPSPAGRAFAYYNMGNAYFTLNARPKALNFFTQAVDIYGGLPELAPDQHFYMGNALLHLGRSQGAITSYRKAVELRPSYAQAHLSLGLAYAAAGNKKAARDEYNTLKALDAARADRLLKVINTGR